MVRYKLLLLLPLFSAFALMQDEDPRLRYILGQFNAYSARNPQQKVFLHLDRNYYEAPGDLWFKAYLVSGTAQLPDTLSTNLVVDLINPHQLVVQTRLIRMKKGFGQGDFIFADTVPEGTYTLRAYTGWMSNYDRGFCFSTSFYVKNPANTNFISGEDLRYNKRTNRQFKEAGENFSIQFLPESGVLTGGIESRVAFRAENGLGKGVNADGVVYNKEKNELLRFKTGANGLGSFLLKVEKDEEYSAEVAFPGGKTMHVKLPKPLGQAYVMHISQAEGSIQIKVESSFPLTDDPNANDIILVGQSQGKICWSELIDMPKGFCDRKVPVKLFPPGITQFTLFDGRGIPRAERLVFISPRDQLQLLPEEVKPAYSTQEQGNIKVQVKDAAGNPARGNFSASIFRIESPDSSQLPASILATLLLNTDLKGVVEDADELLQRRDQEAIDQLDLIMLTHGWRRFDWTKVLAGTYPDFGTPADKGISVTGKITRELFGIPVPGASVYLTVQDAYNDYFKTRADEKARFRFDGLDYPDTIHVVMEANRPNGRKAVLILLDQSEAPKGMEPGKKGNRQELLSRGPDWKYRNVKRPDNSYETEKKKAKLEKIKPLKIHGEADDVIFMDEVPDGFTDMFQVLQGRVPGVTVTGDNVIIRGINTFFGSSEPLFLIDGVMVDKFAFKALNPRDVEVVEVIKGPRTAIYGSRGGNGVIAAYTRRGELMKKGYLEFAMLGYYTPRVFYAPAKSTQPGEGKTPDLRKTLLWEPTLLPDSSGYMNLRFVTSDIPGSYLLDCQGMNDLGQPGMIRIPFVVK